MIGRVLRVRSVERSTAVFREAEDVAEAAGLVRWHLRARQEVTLDLAMSGPESMRSTRDLAARYGAHQNVAVMDLLLADMAFGNFDSDECERAARACIDASRRFHLATEPVAHLWLAGAHALRGDDAAMQASIDAALERDPDDPRILADLHGRVLATRAFVRDELDHLPELMEQMMVEVRRASPASSVYPGRAAWAVLHAIHDDDRGEAVRVELMAGAAGAAMELFVHTDHVCQAIALGRAGDVEGATAFGERAHAGLLQAAIGRGLLHADVAARRRRRHPGRMGRPGGLVAPERRVVRRSDDSICWCGGAGRCSPRRARRCPGGAGATRRCPPLCGPWASPVGRSTCSSWWWRAGRTGRSRTSSTCHPRPSNATSAACSIAPGCGTGAPSVSSVRSCCANWGCRPP